MRVRKITKSDHYRRYVCPSIHLHGNTRLPLDGFSLNLVCEFFFFKCAEKIQFWLKCNKHDGYINDLCKFMILSHWILLRIVGKYGTSGQATDDNIIWRIRIACCVNKSTNTHSDCVILIAFPVQQWLQERTLVLRYTYSALPVLFFPVALRPNAGHGLLIHEVSSSHTATHRSR